MAPVALSFAVAALAAGCNNYGATGRCGAGATCGGDPSGSWAVADGCEFQPVRPTQPIDTSKFMGTVGTQWPALIAPPQPQPTLVQQTQSGDWCSTLLVTGSGASTMVTNVFLWHEAPLVDPADSKVSFFAADHSYTTRLMLTTKKLAPEQRARNATHFAPRCLQANGGNPSCADLGAALTTFYMAATPTVPSTFDNFNCTQSASDGGCDCSYDMNILVTDSGRWLQPNNANNTFDPGQPMVQETDALLFNGVEIDSQGPSPGMTFKTDLCRGGNELELSGNNGTPLLGVYGLVNLTLTPM